MQFGLSKVDITPRVGVELSGYGPFLCRRSTAIREPLFARALAASDGTSTVVLTACDLISVPESVVAEVRERVSAATGIPHDHIMTHAIHPHSVPATKPGRGWGEADPPYMEILPVRIAAACIEAVGNLQPATLSHTVVPCEGIGYNREEEGRPEFEDALREDWRPAKPEITDTEAQILRIDTQDRMLGFATYFSCHPVIGSQTSTYIHSDYAGVATNLLARETPGSIGLFLQGAHGNINTCVVHHPEQESLQALDVIASRYARQVRPGIQDAQPLGGDTVAAIRRKVKLTRDPLPECVLREMLAEREAILKAPDAGDADHELRMATVYAIAIRKELARIEAGEPVDENVEIQGLRIGDVVMVGAPFELMVRYKNRVQAQFDKPVLVMSLCNGVLGYAPEKECFEREGNYAARIVPYLLGEVPFASSLEDELVAELTRLAADLRTVPQPSSTS